jgi:hypothetical protein
MSKDKNFTVETTKTRTFANPQEAAKYARALASHGQISKSELKGVERSVRNAEKPQPPKKR